jgi:DNA (cytosine-5)-methyltransferase 1
VRFLSVCSGIEAASVAWSPLGWEAIAFSEIEKFPSTVLAHHYPTVPNWGDMTKYQEWPDAGIDVLVGGTPCQSFSVAGLRKGLDDPRGNLMLTFGAIAKRYRPRLLVWENVPGVLSSNSGRDFGTFLGMLAELGYGFAYRVLDAQYVRVESHARAVPQRRRRVFVVGCLGDWRRAAAVLFERESLQGHPAPRREAGKNPAGTIGGSSQSGGFRTTDLDNSGAFIPEIVSQAMSSKWAKGSSGPAGDEVANLVAHSLRADGFDASEDGTGRGTPLVAVFDPRQITDPNHRSTVEYGRPSHTLHEHAPAIAIQERAVSENPDNGPDGVGVRDDGSAYTLEARTVPQAVATTYAVRRLTPLECERLQGFPDNYTAIPKAKDGPRYKALGNSMAVNVMSWIGRRIQLANEIEIGEAVA